VLLHQPAIRGATPPRQRAAHVSGRLLTYDNRPLLGAVLVIRPQDDGRAREEHVSQARIHPDGTFVIADVPPGRYTLRARGETVPGGPMLFASFTLSVGDRDVSRIEMTLTPGALLDGRVRFESHHGHERPTGPLRVRAPLPDGSYLGDLTSGAVEADGSFSLRALMPGTHFLTIDGLSHPWRIANARFGGLNLAETPFDVDHNQRISGLEVVVSDTAGAITGTVATSPSAARESVLAVAFPADEARRRVPRLFTRSVRPAADGSYTITDLAPGDYLLVAVLDLTERHAEDMALLERLVPIAERVAVREAQLATVRLHAVRAPAGPLP
jgi:hypothetical protein